MSKRRVRLGSGLDPHKLAGTIRQIAIADPPLPALICHAPEQEDSWMHLAALVGTPEEDVPPPITGWKLTFGYVLQEEPGASLGRLQVDWSAGAYIDGWEAGLCAGIHLPADTAPEAVAGLMVDIACRLHAVDNTQSVETALEYP